MKGNSTSGGVATADPWSGGDSKGMPNATSYSMPDESEEKLQYAFRMIMEVHRGKSTTNENEIRALRQTIDELRINNANLTKKIQSAEREIMEQQHRNQVLVKDNENLAIANRQLLQRCEKYKRIQQTFSEALENSGHDEEIPLTAFSVSAAAAAAATSSSGEFRSAYSSSALGNSMNNLGSVLSPKSAGGSMNFPVSAGPSSAAASAVPTASMAATTTASGTSSGGAGFDSNGKDGKQFFRVVRTRLPFESFNAFLTVIKKLNSHEYTRDVAVEEAKKIFGPENSDLLGDFQSLISRHISASPA